MTNPLKTIREALEIYAEQESRSQSVTVNARHGLDAINDLTTPRRLREVKLREEEKVWFWVWPFKNFPPATSRPILGFCIAGQIHIDPQEVAQQKDGIPYEDANDCLAIPIFRPEPS